VEKIGRGFEQAEEVAGLERFDVEFVSVIRVRGEVEEGGRGVVF
jgi:hypothetical protein